MFVVFRPAMVCELAMFFAQLIATRDIFLELATNNPGPSKKLHHGQPKRPADPHRHQSVLAAQAP